MAKIDGKEESQLAGHTLGSLACPRWAGVQSERVSDSVQAKDWHWHSGCGGGHGGDDDCLEEMHGSGSKWVFGV